MLCAITIKNEKKSIFGVKFSAGWKKFQEDNLNYHAKKTKTCLYAADSLQMPMSYKLSTKKGLLIA